MIDVLVISHACLTGINRLPYRELAKRGWTIEVIIPNSLTIADQQHKADPRSASDPVLHQLAMTSSKPRHYSFEGLGELLDDVRPRLVLVDNDPASRLAFGVGAWAGRNRSKVVCQSCENLSRWWKPSFRRAGFQGLAKSAAIWLAAGYARRSVDHVLVISKDGEQVFTEMGYGGRITRIPLGFDPDMFKPDDSARKRIRSKLGLHLPTVAYFGRTTEEKGVHILIDALARIKNLDWQLLLDEFGQYPNEYQSRLKSMIAQRGLRDRTVYFDARHEEMPGYMNAADIVVVPSITTPAWKEQYGRIAPEAMACGKAVVVSDSGTLPELVGDAAVVFPERDVNQLVCVLEDLIGSGQKRAELGRRATERAHSMLSVHQQVQIMDRLFRDLIGEPSAS